MEPGGSGAGGQLDVGGPGRGLRRRAGLFLKLGKIGDAVIIRHTLFSLPFALVAVFLESDGRPDLLKLALIVVAAASGRNLANALNRLIDRDIDAKNPRTAGRHLPSGSLAPRDLAIFAAVMGALLVGSAAALGWVCLALLPLAGILVFGYSYTKRFTWLCHFWLGVTCAIAPMGSLVALTGRVFELRFFAISAAVAAWVAGFDIIYALQDIEVDRAQGLHSVPERFGEKGARAIAGLCHAAALACFASLPFFWARLGPAYWAGLGIAAILLGAEHLISRGGTERHIRIAAYNVNEIIPLVMLAAVLLDVYLL
jgi:4-hydroxybenzoate polyprenyltransferase